MGINNPHHYTNYSDACADDGVGCDGYIYPERPWQSHSEVPCDCACHGERAPEFLDDDAVREWHEG